MAVVWRICSAATLEPQVRLLCRGTSLCSCFWGWTCISGTGSGEWLPAGAAIPGAPTSHLRRQPPKIGVNDGITCSCTDLLQCFMMYSHLPTRFNPTLYAVHLSHASLRCTHLTRILLEQAGLPVAPAPDSKPELQAQKGGAPSNALALAAPTAPAGACLNADGQDYLPDLSPDDERELQVTPPASVPACHRRS